MKVCQLNSSAVVIIRKGREDKCSSQNGWWEGLGTVSERRRLSNKPKLQKKHSRGNLPNLPKFKNLIYFQPCMTVFLPYHKEDVRQNDNGYHSHLFAWEKLKWKWMVTETWSVILLSIPFCAVRKKGMWVSKRRGNFILFILSYQLLQNWVFSSAIVCVKKQKTR